MSYQQPGPGHHQPPPRPQRAWWWLPEQERRRRREQRRAWNEYQRRNKKNDGGGDTGDCGGDCCNIGDPCLIALIPVMSVAGLRFALGSVLGGRRHRAAAADPSAPVPDGFAAGLLYGAVRHYRTEISPGRAACCPYTPSCSTYAVQALHRHGAVRGARLTAGRLLRCRPGVARRGGVDPVPERH